MTLLLLPFFNPACFEKIASLNFLDTLFTAAKIVSFVAIIVLYLRSNRLSKTVAAIMIYEAVLLFSTVVHFGNYWKLAVNCGTVIGFCMVLEMGLKNNCRVLVNSLFNINFLLCLINALLVIIFPNGIIQADGVNDSVNFLGGDNILPPLMLPAIAVSVLYYEFNGKKSVFRSGLLILSVCVSILVTWSATGVVGLASFILYLLFVYKKKISGLINSAFLGVLYTIAFFALIVFRLQVYFAFIIEDVLHKNVSLTGRTQIWDYALMMIRRSPCFGYGVYDKLIYLRNQYFIHAHNGVLEILLEGGAAALLMFVFLFVRSCSELYRYRGKYISGVITGAFFSMQVLLLSEGYINQMWIFGLMIFAVNISYIAEKADTPVKQDSIEDIPLSKRYIHYRLNRR